MSDNPLYAELDSLRTELAANKRVAARLEEQRAKAEERTRELEQQLADTCSCRFVPDTCDEQVSNGELQRCDYHRDLWTVLSEARQQLAAAQASCTAMRQALEAWRAWCLDERHSVADDTQLFEAAIELMDDALAIKEAQDTTNMCPRCGKALMGKPLGCVIHGLVDPIEEAPDV